VGHEQLEPVVEALERSFGDRLVAVALFGSRARGDARPDSDWDLLVVARDLPASPLQRVWTVKSAIPPYWRARVSVLARTPEEFEARLTSLHLDLALDAVVLFERHGYASTKLDALRRLIERKRLRRVRRGQEWVWDWVEFPGPSWHLSWEEAL
jgi:predicted nucleotidyltransferase